MKTCIIIVEDKPEEQEKALAAVMSALSLTRGGAPIECANDIFEKFLGTRLIPCWDSLIFTADNLDGFLQYAPPFQEGMQFEKTLILTDLMFPQRKGEKENMNGLQVVIEAIERGISVVVCSDTDHHDLPFMPRLIRTLEKSHLKGRIPVVLDNKDWEKAIVLGLELLGS
ncbi:MAG: hypothetical protein Q8O53_01575 [Candidatus Moranbacteria bacterium]|nr:hypothetical protein [Candidatus Moranbacteria bacterium]